MKTDERLPDDIIAMFTPLPELDGENFTRSVIKRTSRIQLQRRIIHVVTYVIVAAFGLAALPWQSLIADLNNVGDAISFSAEPVLQINSLTEWLQSKLSFQEFRTQQIVIAAGLASVLGGVISFVMTEA